VTEQRCRVLVACPTYAVKEYALDAWVAGSEAMTYAPRYAYQVDNTAVSEAYFERVKATGIDATHIVPWPDWDRTFKRCWELILERAQRLDCYWILSMEADNVVAPEGLGIMVDMALAGACHLVTHSYPQHRSAAEASGVDPEGFSGPGLLVTVDPLVLGLLNAALSEVPERFWSAFPGAVEQLPVIQEQVDRLQSELSYGRFLLVVRPDVIDSAGPRRVLLGLDWDHDSTDWDFAPGVTNPRDCDGRPPQHVGQLSLFPPGAR